MNVAALLLIGIVVIALGFWKFLAWSIVLWIVGAAASLFVIAWLVRVLLDGVGALGAKLRRERDAGLRELRRVPGRVRDYWTALPTIRKVAVAGAVGVAGTAVVGGTLLATGSTAAHRVVLAAAPLLVAWSGSEPAYNAFLSPQFDGGAAAGPNAIVVRAGAPTRLSFGISPQWMANSIVKANPNPAITRGEVDVPLKVTVTCDFCAAHDAVMEPMVYRPSARSSNFVTFDFVPRGGEQASLTKGQLVVSVVHMPTLQEYDRLPITVLVDSRPGEAKETEARVPLDADVNRSLAASREEIADVELSLFEHQDRQVRVQLQPVREDLKRALEPYVLDGAGNPRSFVTSVFGQSDMQAITTSGYTRLSELSLQGPLASRLAGVTISKGSRVSSKLQPDEARGVRRAIALTGATLYRKLFVDAVDPALGEAIELLESYEEKNKGSRPLRLLVRTDLQLPWQYLHPVGVPAEGMKFWGMRFNLAVERIRFEVPSVPDAAGAEAPRKVVFARYALHDDDSWSPANGQIGLLKGFSNVEVVESKDQLFAVLNAQRRSVAAIVTFLHASSTEVLPASGGNVPLAPRLYFAPGDAVAVDELEGLLNALDRKQRQAEPRYLRGAPLVILNACETGPSTIALPHLTLKNMMFKLGARGVVATEVSVWIPLANEVGQRLITRLGKGEPASGALTAIRRELDDKFDNPLGLLYAYYGTPPVGLKP